MGGLWVVLIIVAFKILVYVLQQAARGPESRTGLPSIRSWRPDRTVDPGIQFLGPVSVSTGGKGTNCQVCGSEVVQDLVSCNAGATLHHRECWDYNRGCSTYGCRPAASLEI